MQLSVTIKSNPFSRLLLVFLAGILVPAFTMPGISLFVPGFLLLTFFIAFLLICRKAGFHTGWHSGLMAAVMLFCVGMTGMCIYIHSAESVDDQISGTVLLEVKEPVVETARTVRTIAGVFLIGSEGSTRKSRQKILVFFAKDSLSSSLVPGNRLLADIHPRQIPPPANPLEFNYKRYLASSGIFSQAYIGSASWHLCTNSRNLSLRSAAFDMQQFLLRQYRKTGMDQTLFSILSALTLGYKNDLDAHTRQVFSEAGVMHVMALSGFNVAVIAFALGYLLFFTGSFRGGKIVKTLLIFMMIWLFVAVTGLSPSVTRAAVMISFILAATLLERKVKTGNILFISAFILLAWRPAMIRDVSFQLSFAAVAGILVLHPALYSLVKFRHNLADKIWQLFTVSCGAQLATLPLTLFYFHQFPVYFWLTNLYVIPLVSVIICVAGVFLLVSCWEQLMLLVGKILTMLVALLYKSVAFTERLPFAVIDHIRIDPLQSVLLIVVLIFIGLGLVLRRRILFIPASVTMALVLFAGFSHIRSLNHQQMVLVGNFYNASAIHIINGRKCLLFTNPITTADDRRLKYAFENFWIDRGVARYLTIGSFDMPEGYQATWLGKNKLFMLKHKSILILTDNSFFRWSAGTPLSIDLLIITGGVERNMSALTGMVKPRRIILDSSVNRYAVSYWKNAARKEGIPCTSVTEEGAFLMSTE